MQPTNDLLRHRLEIYRIDADTLASARKFWYAIRPEFNDITLRFYSHLRANPETARFLPGERGIERLRAAQTVHWEELFTGRFDADYVRRVTATAQAHLRVRLPNYHYMAAYAFFLNELVAGAHRLFADDAAELTPVVTAINKLVMIDMDVTMSFYMQRLMRGSGAEPSRAGAPAQENA